MPKCKLCLKEDADKKNSHIIPKFMGKRLFESSQPRHSVRIDISGGYDKIQDTPKEDFIFCSRCENRFAILEHYFSLKLTSIHNFKNEKNKFKIHIKGKNSILECLKIPFNAMKLFNYLLVWKTSVSNLNEFLKFKLPESSEKKLREFLDSNLTDSHSDLIKNLNKIPDDSDFNSYFFKCIVKNEYSRGIFTAYEFGENAFGLFLVDIIIFFYIDKNRIPEDFNVITDIQNENTFIAMADIQRWKELNSGPIQNIGKNYS